MSNFSLGASLKLTGFDLKVCRKQIIGWCVAIFSIMFLYMILFPTVKDMAQLKLDAMPKEILEMFGMENFTDMANFTSYFGMIYSIVIIAISIFAATISANLICKEEKSKTIEFLYSLEVSRTEIYISKLITAFIAVFMVVLSAVVSTAICGMITGGETFVAADFLQIAKISSITAFFFMTVSLLLAGITTKIGVSVTSSMIVLLCYMLGYLSKLLGDKAQWLVNLSPFELFNSTNALALEGDTMAALGVYFAIMVIFVVVGGIVYKRRDFNI